MDRILSGYRRFRETQWPDLRALYASLATKGQAPLAVVIGCSDSRVDPQMILGMGPGELFTVRNVANLVPPYQPNADYHGTSAALEFAVRSLRVSHAVVLGHARCGGIAALLRGPAAETTDFIGSWMSIATPARVRALAAGLDDPAQIQLLAERESLKVSLENLLTFPWIAEAVTAGTLRLHGWYFDIETGVLLRLGESGGFEPLDGTPWEQPERGGSV